ncbi:MAG: inorganic pyrophosphatase [Candidatus Woesearchaeota archaeon]|jgi:inorganic pyrophosphatase
MNAWHDIAVGKDQPKIVNAIIEIPKNSSVKYELDKDSGLLMLDRHMHSAVYYPMDYGFIPKTYCDDKDPLDIFLIGTAPTYPLTLCEAKVLGVIKMIDDGEQDDKIIAVHAGDHIFKEWDSLDDVPKHMIAQLKNFLQTYKILKGDEVIVSDILGKEEAYKVVTEAIALYKSDIQKE